MEINKQIRRQSLLVIGCLFIRGHSCGTILNVHALTEDKSNGTKYIFYDEVEYVSTS
jgi:hypothetical protein